MNAEETNSLMTNNKYEFLQQAHREKLKKVFNKNNTNTLDKIGLKIFAFLAYLETKIFALISIILAVIVIYFSNFFTLILEHSEVDYFYLSLSIILYITTFSIFLYLCIYLPYLRKEPINENKWSEYCPNMIPTATICGVLGMIMLILSVWDVWRWYTIPIVLIIKWGFVMTAHFAPGGALGNIIFILLIIGMITSGYFIEHRGHLHYGR